MTDKTLAPISPWMFNIHINLICYISLALGFGNIILASFAIPTGLMALIMCFFRHTFKKFIFDYGFQESTIKLRKLSYKLRLITFTPTLFFYIAYISMIFFTEDLVMGKILYIFAATGLVLPLSLLYCLFYRTNRQEYYHSIFVHANVKYVPILTGFFIGVAVTQICIN